MTMQQGILPAASTCLQAMVDDDVVVLEQTAGEIRYGLQESAYKEKSQGRFEL